MYYFALHSDCLSLVDCGGCGEGEEDDVRGMGGRHGGREGGREIVNRDFDRRFHLDARLGVLRVSVCGGVLWASFVCVCVCVCVCA